MKAFGMGVALALMVSSVGMVAAAIWTEHHWQWLLSAILSLLVGMILYAAPPGIKLEEGCTCEKLRVSDDQGNPRTMVIPNSDCILHGDLRGSDG